MRVTFRPIDDRDCAFLGWPKGRASQLRRGGFSTGSVVTINGRIVVAVDRNRTVIYQDGSDAVADLIRAQRRVWRALTNWRAGS